VQPSPLPAGAELRQALAAVRPQLSRAAGLSLLGGLLALSSSVYMLAVYDRVLNSRNTRTLLMLTGLVMAVYALMEVLEWARSQLLHQASEAWADRLRPRVFGAMFSVNLHRQGSTTDQPMQDLRAVADCFNAPVLAALLEAPVALVLLAVLFAIHPLLGWASAAAALAQAALAGLTQRGTHAALTQVQRDAAAAQRLAHGALRHAQVMAAMGMLAPVQARWQALQRDWLARQAQAAARHGGYQAASRGLQNVVGSGMLGLGAWLVLRNDLEGGAGLMIVASVLSGRVLAPLVQVISHWRSLDAVLQAWRRLGQLLAQVPPRAPTLALPAPLGQLSVENLYAVAPGAPAPLLKGLNLTLQAGEVLAVVGPSGAGKTTLARVLTGVWPPASGRVRLDGSELSQLDKARHGPHLGYLPQEVALFDGTLADNIARFGAADAGRVEAAARAVGLHEAILAWPEGYDTPVGHDGMRLSGGIRQRVGLARALYGEPAFVVLDEPNASLDEAGDAALTQALRDLKARGASVVVMTHRANVLAVADKMLVLQDGQARAFGPRDEVLDQLRKAHSAQPLAGSAR
jgi:ATP-binding cassette subfamily C exporter for protease/lipase